jgi:acyl-CoA reductase-like NAD-dependent aldehyde dehydrogenase
VKEIGMADPTRYVSREPYKLYIGGELVPSCSGATFDIINPVTNEPFARAYQAGVEDVQRAIAAARTAFDEGPWGSMSGLERSRLLLKARDALAARADEFAHLETLDCGKVYPSVRFFESGLGDAGVLKYMHPKTIFVDLNEESSPPV